jgi:hypothetical protein
MFVRRLKETAEKAATLIVAEIETKQSAGTLDLSDTNNATVAAILEIKEAQEVVTQTGLDATTIAAVSEVAKAAAETNTLIATQVATSGVTVLTSTTTATALSEIVENNTTLATQLVTNEITADEFTTQADVTTQASASGGLDDAVAALPDPVDDPSGSDSSGSADSTDSSGSNGSGNPDADNLGGSTDIDTTNKQIINSDSALIAMPTNNAEEVTLTISYQTNPLSTVTTGVGVKMFFDSDKLTFVSLEVDSIDDLLQATRTSNDIRKDSNNLDLDLSTDKFANVAYTSFSGEFATPLSPLYRATFRAKDGFISGTTQINFALVTAAGFSSEANSVILTF